jgi:starch synthase
MRILMVASEAAPFAKTGGLADVVGALPRALRALGHEVAVFLPRYRRVDLTALRRVADSLPVDLAGTRHDASLFMAERDVPFYFFDCPPLFDREQFYGIGATDYPDNYLRFAVFCRAVFPFMRRVFLPEVVHLHDWQTGLFPVYLKTRYSTEPTFLGIRTLFTIHNLGYHGRFPRERMAEIELDSSLLRPNLLEFYGDFSFVKGGLVFSDGLSTVSRRYAQEIQTPEFGAGLDGLLRERSADLTGILNGVDYEHWTPETGEFLPAPYSVSDRAGKRVCKRHLLDEFGLPPAAMDRPLFGMVTRLDPQKGVGLVIANAGEFEALDAYLVVLGSGNKELETRLQAAAASLPGRVAVRIGYDNALAHRIEAGADAFLMPSWYEPCGLNQMYSLRYGAVPVVRATGGLDDTIEEDTGFKFSEFSEAALRSAIRTACAAYEDRDRWTAMMKIGMQKDFSWSRSAAQYAGLYRRLRRLNPAEAEPTLIT